jgi:hypothetical protein
MPEVVVTLLREHAPTVAGLCASCDVEDLATAARRAVELGIAAREGPAARNPRAFAAL